MPEKTVSREVLRQARWLIRRAMFIFADGTGSLTADRAAFKACHFPDLMNASHAP
jgi:hypothetical protein